MDTTFILPVAVIRKFGEKGAEFSRLMVLNNFALISKAVLDQKITRQRISDLEWEDILEEAVYHGAPNYYKPDHTFSRENAHFSSGREFTSIIYSLVFSGSEGKILAGVFGMADAEKNKKPGENFPLLPHFLDTCRAIEENGSINQAVLGTLTAVANKIVALRIPALVPYGQSELQASGLL